MSKIFTVDIPFFVISEIENGTKKVVPFDAIIGFHEIIFQKQQNTAVCGDGLDFLITSFFSPEHWKQNFPDLYARNRPGIQKQRDIFAVRAILKNPLLKVPQNLENIRLNGYMNSDP